MILNDSVNFILFIFRVKLNNFQGLNRYHLTISTHWIFPKVFFHNDFNYMIRLLRVEYQLINGSKTHCHFMVSNPTSLQGYDISIFSSLNNKTLFFNILEKTKALSYQVQSTNLLVFKLTLSFVWYKNMRTYGWKRRYSFDDPKKTPYQK